MKKKKNIVTEIKQLGKWTNKRCLYLTHICLLYFITMILYFFTKQCRTIKAVYRTILPWQMRKWNKTNEIRQTCKITSFAMQLLLNKKQLCCKGKAACATRDSFIQQRCIVCTKNLIAAPGIYLSCNIHLILKWFVGLMYIRVVPYTTLDPTAS